MGHMTETTISALEIGDYLRIVNVPTWLTHGMPKGEAKRLRALEGSVWPLMAVDAAGYVWVGDDETWICLFLTDVERA